MSEIQVVPGYPAIFMNGAVLLIGFNRPQLLQDRLKELDELIDAGINIYVSIDGPRPGNLHDESAHMEIKSILDGYSRNKRINFLYSPSNKGCDKHIFDSISHVLSLKKFVIVIEDDVAMSQAATQEILNKAMDIYNLGKLNPVVAMSGAFFKFAPIQNIWRKSNYFSAWGFAVNENFWNLHQQTLAQTNPDVIEELKSNSATWVETSQRKQQIWNERIGRTNYDYLIQRTIFLRGINTIAPLFRISDNLGHGIIGAAHTRFRTPWYLKYSTFGKNDDFKKGLVSSHRFNSLLTWTDSQTWAGDGLFSVRGRTTGIRTHLKRFLAQ